MCEEEAREKGRRAGGQEGRRFFFPVETSLSFGEGKQKPLVLQWPGSLMDVDVTVSGSLVFRHWFRSSCQ